MLVRPASLFLEQLDSKSLRPRAVTPRQNTIGLGDMPVAKEFQDPESLAMSNDAALPDSEEVFTTPPVRQRQLLKRHALNAASTQQPSRRLKTAMKPPPESQQQQQPQQQQQLEQQRQERLHMERLRAFQNVDFFELLGLTQDASPG